MAPTYDPATSLFFVTSRDQCDTFSTAPQPYEAGHAYMAAPTFLPTKPNLIADFSKPSIPQPAR